MASRVVGFWPGPRKLQLRPRLAPVKLPVGKRKKKKKDSERCDESKPAWHSDRMRFFLPTSYIFSMFRLPPTHLILSLFLWSWSPGLSRTSQKYCRTASFAKWRAALCPQHTFPLQAWRGRQTDPQQYCCLTVHLCRKMKQISIDHEFGGVGGPFAWLS